MSGLPTSIRKDVVEGERLHQQILDRKTAATGLPAAGAIEPAAPVVHVATAADPSAAPGSPAPTPQGVVSDPQDENYRQRFINLKTRYDDNISQARQEAREEKAGRERAEAELTQLRASTSSNAPPTSGSRSFNVEDVLTEEEREYMGPEGANAVLKLSDAAAQRAIGAMRHELAEMKSQQQSERDNASSRTEQSFYSDLLSFVPNYAAINLDPAWLTYLAEIDPVTQMERQVALDTAAKRFNAAAVASVFNGFLRVAQMSQSVATGQVAPLPPVLPATPRGASQDQGSIEVEIWNEREIAEFFAQYDAFFRRSGPKDPERLRHFNETERKIAQARKEGRIEP